jgi:hypothetical protein
VSNAGSFWVIHDRAKMSERSTFRPAGLDGNPIKFSSRQIQSLAGKYHPALLIDKHTRSAKRRAYAVAPTGGALALRGLKVYLTQRDSRSCSRKRPHVRERATQDGLRFGSLPHQRNDQLKGPRAMITGDFARHPCQFAHPEWSSTADYDPAAAEGTRHGLLSALAGEPVLVIGTHFVRPTAGHVVGDGQTYKLRV